MLDKKDPVYYKAKLKELLQQAKNNNIDILIDKNKVTFTSSHTITIGQNKIVSSEIASLGMNEI